MIDIRKLKELVRLMVDNDLVEIDLRDSKEQVTMRRPNAAAMPQVYHAPVPIAFPPSTYAPIAGPSLAATTTPAAPSDDAGLTRIESPMVGTFYVAANPDSPAFASVGTQVSPDKVVCIIEAMKIFNEIKAECAGTIAKVLVKNGQAVEFGQPLFLVKPG